MTEIHMTKKTEIQGTKFTMCRVDMLLTNHLTYTTYL